jgi:hypothetical protein
MLTFPIPTQGLQAVSWRNTKGVEAGGGIQSRQFTHGNPLDVGRQFQGLPASENPLRLFAFE